MNIAEILAAHAATFGDRVAMVEARRQITFAALDRAVSAAAARLARAGVEPGMRTLVFCPMAIDLYVTVIALFRLGAVAVFADPSAGAANLARCIARVRPGAFVATRRAHLLRLTSRAVRRIPIKGSIPLPGEGEWPIHPCGEQTPAIITFTSGTTGDPKAIVRTHGFLRAQHRAIVEALDLAPGDVDLATLPVFVLANLASGVPTIIPNADLRAPGAIDPVPVLEQVRRHRPTRTVASPALLERLTKGAEERGGCLDSFRKIFTGGAPVFPRAMDSLAACAPHARIVAVYGSSEAEPIAAIERAEITAADRQAMRQGAGVLAGRPAASTRVRILAGEIIVSGPHVLEGYLDGEGNEETKITLEGAMWHRTGDAGYFDEHGRLWLLGRCAARVTDDRGVLYPLAVECAASEIPGIRRSALVQHRGRRVLVVETDSTIEGRASVLTQLAWAHLDDVAVIGAIPVDRRHNAKIDLPALERMMATR